VRVVTIVAQFDCSVHVPTSIVGWIGGLSREVGALVVDEQRIKDAALVALGDTGFADAWPEGESMTVAQASAEILETR
jgi:hypothetical protein